MPEAALQKKMRHAHTRYVQQYAHAAYIIDTIGDALLERLSFIKIQPKRIVDLGSGLGYTSRALAKRYPDAEVIALDFTPAMSQAAKAACASEPRIKILSADAYHLPLANQSVDLLIANLLLPALLDYPALWLECQRVLVPGGLLMFSNLGPDTLLELRQSFVDGAQHVNTFIDLHDVGDGLLEIAFMDPVLDNDYFHLSYASLPALLHELKAMGSLKFIEAGTQAYVGKKAWAAVEHRYRQQFVDAKQRLLVTVEAYFGHAFNPLQKSQRPDVEGNVSIPLSAIKRPAVL